MKLGRNQQHSFAQIPSVTQARSTFDRSFPKKDTMNFNELTPIMVDEIIPGDTVKLNVKHFTRLATQVVPVMDNMYMDFFSFFVPLRLVWDNFQRFMGEQPTPGASTDFVIPITVAPNDILPGTNGFQVGSNYDHIGIPTQIPSLEVNSLFLRAINLCFNEWFRDENLMTPLPVPKGDGPDNYLDFNGPIPFARKHDYFSSCLPWPQKGPSVPLTMQGTAPVFGQPLSSDDSGHLWKTWTGSSESAKFRIDAQSDGTLFGNPLGISTGLALGRPADYEGTFLAKPPYTDASMGNLFTTINNFRQAIMMQSLLELDARGGTRYIELVKAHFGVTNPDFRLQRPEFLGGGTSYINQHPVAQTSETLEDGSPLGTLAAFSTSAETGNKIGFSKSFTEHGVIIVFARARGDVSYQQGLNKMFSRRTKFDFFWPKLQELGEQAVLQQEIYATSNDADNKKTFGFNERYAEYRYRPPEICGQFRSTYTESLDVWHLAEEFSSAPQLNADFIKNNTPIERSLEVTEGYPALKCDFWFDYQHTRPMMSYGVPATLGRF